MAISSATASSFGARSMETTHRTILMLRAKIVVVGDACVGKTALVQMLKSGGHDYPKSYIMVSQPVKEKAHTAVTTSLILPLELTTSLRW